MFRTERSKTIPCPAANPADLRTGITRDFTLWKSKRALAFCSKFKDVVFPVSVVYFTLQYVSPRSMNSQFRPVSYLAPRLRGVKLKK